MKKDLMAFVWILANQESYRSIGSRFDLAKSSLSNVFFDHVKILNKIAGNFIRWPNREEKNVAMTQFARGNKISGVVGAIDGTYVAIKAPSAQRLSYTNRKFFTSMTLQAICDHKLQYIDCFAGYSSSCHDITVFRQSPIYNQIKENPAVYFPSEEKILGEKAYPFKTWCLTPFRVFSASSTQGTLM